jgi:hypothetical protein
MEPLVKVLRLADGDGSSSGYILFAIKLAKEGIKEFFTMKLRTIRLLLIS